MRFNNFSFKNTSWLKVGNFKIFDENNELAYKVESSVWSFKKVFHLKDMQGREIYKIAANSAFNTSYDLYDQESLIAHIEKPFSWSSQVINLEVFCNRNRCQWLHKRG